IAGKRQNRAHLHTWLAHINEQKSDPLLWFDAAVSAYQAEDVIGKVRMSGPQLCAVHQVVVVFASCDRTQACEIRACARLGESLTPVMLAREDFWQVMRLLSWCAVGVQNRCEQLQPQHRQARRIGERTFLFEDI